MRDNISFVLKTPWLFLATLIMLFAVLRTHFNFEEGNIAPRDSKAAGTIYVSKVDTDDNSQYTMIPENFYEDPVIFAKKHDGPTY